ncbi:MAG: TetR family transcriptional regulator [Rhodobacteraceae bacterium]|nr:TetR family transcriptional regulator [Paracoccaceae bacterium]
MTQKSLRPRDAEATRARILAAAKSEFARLGLAGARVDVIAAKAEANKRMIYHYFGSKESLFTHVLEAAYLDIRTAEQQLDLDSLPPRAALERLVRFTWDYYLDNPEFITLINSENLHRGRHLARSAPVERAAQQFVDMVKRLLDRGVAEGVFRPGIDPIQLNITIAAIGYYYLTNRFTGAIVFKRDFMAPEALEERARFNLDTILRLVAV